MKRTFALLMIVGYISFKLGLYISVYFEDVFLILDLFEKMMVFESLLVLLLITIYMFKDVIKKLF